MLIILPGACLKVYLHWLHVSCVWVFIVHVWSLHFSFSLQRASALKPPILVTLIVGLVFLQTKGAVNAEGLDESFEPWSSKKAGILAKFTTSEKLSITTSFLSASDKEKGMTVFTTDTWQFHAIPQFAMSVTRFLPELLKHVSFGGLRKDFFFLIQENFYLSKWCWTLFVLLSMV